MQAGKGQGPCSGCRGSGPRDHAASAPDGPLRLALCPGNLGLPRPQSPGPPVSPNPPRARLGGRPFRDSAEHHECQRATGWARPRPLRGRQSAGRGGRGAAGKGLWPEPGPHRPPPPRSARARLGRTCARRARRWPRTRGPRSGQAGWRAGSLTGLRRFSVAFFQSSSCSWCRKPMAGPRSGRLRAAAAPLRAPRAPPPAAPVGIARAGRGFGRPGPAPRWPRPGAAATATRAARA